MHSDAATPLTPAIGCGRRSARATGPHGQEAGRCGPVPRIAGPAVSPRVTGVGQREPRVVPGPLPPTLRRWRQDRLITMAGIRSM